VLSAFCVLQSCKGGRVQQVEELIFYGADMNQQNAGGNTALHVSAANDQVGVSCDDLR